MMKYCTEIQVNDVLNFKSNPLKLKDLTSMLSISKNKELQEARTQEFNLYESFFQYLEEVKEIISKNKLKPNQVISIAFHPIMKKKSQDSLHLSKLGGVPFCFINDVKEILSNKRLFIDKMKDLYPKDEYGKYFNFVGDIDSHHPTFFLNEIIPLLTYRRYSKTEKINQLYYKDNYSTKQNSSVCSVFLDQDIISMSSQKTNTVIISKKYLDLDTYSAEDIQNYILLMNDFVKNEVKPEYYAIDKFELSQIESWYPVVELKDSKNFGTSKKSLSLRPDSNNSLKLFGYAESQQSVYPYYSVFGEWGPRLLSPFLTIHNHNVDSTIQIYADMVIANSTRERIYLKSDISST